MPETQTNGIDDTLPDIVRDFLAKGGQLEDITLHDDGRWTHEGLDFENPRIIDLFSRSVARTDGGTWILEIGRFTYPINVEDTGFFVERVDLDASPPTLHLSDHTRDTLAPDTLEYHPGGKLVCRVKQGAFRARFKRQAYYALGDLLVEEDGQIELALDGARYPLSSMDAEE